MKITDVEAMVLDTGKNYTNPADGAEAHGVRFVSLVKVITDEGIVGWSDIETQPHVAKAIVDTPSSGCMGFEGLRDLLVGRDADDIDGAWEMMYVGASYYGRAGAVMQVMSGIDIALWDIRGKARGLPICELLGDKQRDSVRAYASTLFRPTPDAMKEAVSDYLDQGFGAIKFGWGPFGQDSALDISLVRAAREQAGPDATLMVDAGWFSQVRNRPLRRRTVQEWQPVLRVLEEAEVFWLEDCCHPQHYHEYAELGASTSVQIAAGEQEATVPGFVDLMDRGKISVAQPDISRCGGLTVAREVAREAAARGVAVCPHAWLTDLLSATSLHLNAILPTSLFLEYNVSSSSLLRTLCKDPIQLKDGRINVPTGAGSGVEVDEAVIEKYRVA